MRRVAEIEGAHQMPVRDVDVARGSAHLLLSAGDDCRLRIWDMRHAPATMGCKILEPPVSVVAAWAFVMSASRLQLQACTWAVQCGQIQAALTLRVVSGALPPDL